MKHMFLKCSSLLMLSVALFVSSCQKGDVGPAGEKGDKGDKGDTGVAGPTGKTGTANVIYSDWKSVQFGTTDVAGVLAGELVDDKINADIVSKGEVKVYWNVATAAEPYIVPLPFVDAGQIVGAADLVINPLITVGGVILHSNYNVGTRTSTTTGELIFQYRYIIIPGGVAARSAINWNDYKQVQQYLGLKD